MKVAVHIYHESFRRNQFESCVANLSSIIQKKVVYISRVIKKEAE